MVRRGAAPLGAREHLARLPRTGAGRQGRDTPVKALRRDLHQGSSPRPRGSSMSSVARLIERIEDEMTPDQTSGENAAINAEHLRMTEALLFAASEPLDEKTLATSLPEGADVPGLLAELQRQYEKRG